MNTLKKGNQGIEVEFLTRELQLKGLLDKVTNIFDRDVESAVRNLQFLQDGTDNNGDGIVGKDTWKQLGIYSELEYIVGELKHIVIHCTDTPEGREVTYQDVYGWHTNPEPQGRGWSDIAYGILIGLNHVWYTRNLKRTDTKLIPDTFYDKFIFNNEKTFGVRGHNNDTIDICYVGGKTKNMVLAKDTITDFQLMILKQELMKFIVFNPNILIGGHNQFANKDCPSFDTQIKLREIGIPEKNIYKG